MHCLASEAVNDNIIGKLYCMITPCIKLIIKPFIKVYQCFFRVSQNLQKMEEMF